MFFYNFGTTVAQGNVRVSVPNHWSETFPGTLEIAPGERKEEALNLVCRGTNSWTEAGVRITGDFGDAGQPTLALRFKPAD